MQDSRSPRETPPEKITDTTKDFELGKNIVVGVSENIGKRPFQEDAITFAAGKANADFAALPASEQKDVMTTAFLDLQQAIAKHAESGPMGSCACVATGWVDKVKVNLSTSYVGDSVSYLVILDHDNNLKLSQACNTALHDGHNEEELAAIREGRHRAKNDNMEDRGRVGGIAVTRALGDRNAEAFGMSHDPQTVKITCPVESTDKVFMVVACDGAMEYLKGKNVAEDYAKDLGKLVEKSLKENPAISPSELAKSAVSHAMKQPGADDNVSVVVVPLKSGHAPVTAAVFDGHGGFKVSQQVGETFNRHFDDAVRLHQLLAETKHRSLPTVRTALDKMLHDQSTTFIENKLLDVFINKIKEQAAALTGRDPADAKKRADLYFVIDKVNEIRMDHRIRQEAVPMMASAEPEKPKLDKRAMMQKQKGLGHDNNTPTNADDNNALLAPQRAALETLYDCLNQSKKLGSVLQSVKTELEEIKDPKVCMAAIVTHLNHGKVPEKESPILSSLHKSDPAVLVRKLMNCLDAPKMDAAKSEAILGALRKALPPVSPKLGLR